MLREPIIILGAARSGTKFIREVLSGSRSVATVPYDVNYIWRYGNERHPDDALPRDAARPEVKRYIRSALAKQGRVSNTRPILLEKTVSNTLRVPFVDEVLPDARFVHIIRDGRAVVESALRMWRQAPRLSYLLRKARTFPLANYRYAGWFLKNMVARTVSSERAVRVWGPRYPGIDRDVASRELVEVCATQWLTSVESARHALECLPRDRVMVIRYESLIASNETAAQLAEFAKVPDVGAVLEAYQRTVRRDTGGGWERLGSPERALAAEILNPQLSELGYA